VSPPHQRANSRRLALEVLREWERGSVFAHDLVDRAATTHGLEPRDAALLQTLVLTTLRHLTLLDHFAAQLCDWERVEERFRWTVRLGLVQLLVLEMAPHAAVNETVAIAERVRSLVNAVLRRAQRERNALLAEAAEQPIAIRHSHPEWLVHRWENQFGREQAAQLCEWDQQPAPVFVRLNQLHPDVPNATATASMPAVADPYFFQAEQPPRDWLSSGKCYAQDPSTALACLMLDPKPEESVLDACAAPGGKTALLAQMMNNTGRLVACDSVPKRMTRLQENLRRMRVTCARVAEHDWLKSKTAPWGALRFDRILLDAPCSNTGVMRRRVDVRWRLQPKVFAEMASLQSRLLDAVLPFLSRGGTLVYSTCSLDAEENEQVVDSFLQKHEGLRCTEMKHSLPWRDHFDGAFAAKLVLTE
jgi:16S rRNA (cytosine967-C5)-methyltransferase